MRSHSSDLLYDTYRLYRSIGLVVVRFQLVEYIVAEHLTLLLRMQDSEDIYRVSAAMRYYFADYTLERVREVDPAVDAIICSIPAGQYSDSAKRHCIESGIGLFMLGEFMGPIRYTGEQYRNFLIRSDREDCINRLNQIARESAPLAGIQILAFGLHLGKGVRRAPLQTRQPYEDLPIGVGSSLRATSPCARGLSLRCS